MAIFSNIFLSFSTQKPRASARGQKSGFFQFFLKTKVMPEVLGFQQSTIIFFWVRSHEFSYERKLYEKFSLPNKEVLLG
jgi:hypothetical protein